MEFCREELMTLMGARYIFYDILFYPRNIHFGNDVIFGGERVRTHTNNYRGIHFAIFNLNNRQAE